MRDSQDICTAAAGQAVTAAAYSTGSKDKGLAALDYASGEVIYGCAIVTTALTDGGSNTGTEVWWADDAVSPTGGAFGTVSGAKLQRLGLFPQAAVVGAASSFIQTPLAPLTTTQQLMGFHFDPLTANLTGGKIVAGFTTDPSTWAAYASAYTVTG